ncbi:MAG: fused MFS/spermidine synthase [Rickettsiales bacterium]|jgi:predicted membrane-bound spermidine synthase|nr:fused MFS/spermidine synthase [Rickettsiales bacterium]
MEYDKGKKFTTLALIALNGYIGLALELIVLRQVANFAGNTAAISSIIIGVYLGAMTIGYFLGAKKSDINITDKKICVGFLFIASLIVLAASYPMVFDYFGIMSSAGIVSNIVQTFIYSFSFLFAAGVLFGFNTAALAQNVSWGGHDNAGVAMGVGTIGSVLGSLLTTLIFMSIFGTNYAIILTVILACGCAFAAFRRLWSLMISVAIIFVAYFFNNGSVLRKNYGVVSNNAESTVAVFNTTNARYLMVDSALHSAISNDGTKYAGYINYINEHFIDTIPSNEIKEILVLGAGGFTVGNLDERNNYTFVDINSAMRDVAERHFLKKKLSANKRFVVQDAGQFLRTTSAKYDLVLMDIFSRWSIPESAITNDFMSWMKSVLKPGGIIAMNIIASPAFGDEFARKLDNTIRSVFPHNLSRQIIGDYNGWKPIEDTNLLYIYFDSPNSGAVYTPNKNSTIYDKKTAV